MKKLSDEQKGKIISSIMGELKNQAYLLNKPFDEGIFFNLAFMSDKELLKTKSICGL